MTDLNELLELKGEILRFFSVSNRLFSAIYKLFNEDIPKIGMDSTTSMAAAGFLENYYTATETVLMRISQVFGNRLNPERWHADLLDRMRMDVPSLRPAAISEST